LLKRNSVVQSLPEGNATYPVASPLRVEERNSFGYVEGYLLGRDFARDEFLEVRVGPLVSLPDTVSFLLEPWRFDGFGVMSVPVIESEVSSVSFLNSSSLLCLVFSLARNPSRRGFVSCFFGCSVKTWGLLVSLDSVRMSCCSKSHSCLTCEEHSSASLMNCRATAMFLSSSLSRDSTWSARVVFAMSEKALVSLVCNFDISVSNDRSPKHTI